MSQTEMGSMATDQIEMGSMVTDQIEMGSMVTDQIEMGSMVTDQIEMEKMGTNNLTQHLYDNIPQICSKRILPFVLIIIVTIIYLASQKIEVNFSYRQMMYSHTNLKNISDQIDTSRSRNEFDVVLSYYTEDVAFVARFIGYLRNASTLQKLQSRVIVYNKNSKINDTYLKNILKADIVIKLPNLGREGATYLYHIIENYDILAKHIIFSQAGVEGITGTGLEEWFANRLEKQFNSTVGYMPLVQNNMLTTFDCGLRPGENMQRLPELWGIIEQTLCPPDRQAVAFRGQFLVSAKRIRSRSLRIYKYIYYLITANATHWIHNDARSVHFVPSSVPDNPNFGHVVERLWTTLFNCTKRDLPDRCVRNECACFD